MIVPRYHSHRHSAWLVCYIYAGATVVVTYHRDTDIEVRIPVTFPNASEWRVRRGLFSLRVLPPAAYSRLALLDTGQLIQTLPPVHIVLPGPYHRVWRLG